VSVVRCQVEVSAMRRLLVQRSHTKCDVSECDREASSGAVEPWNTYLLTYLLTYSMVQSPS